MAINFEQLMRDVTRIVVNHPKHGKVLENFNVKVVEVQDRNRTLKVHLNENEENKPEYHTLVASDEEVRKLVGLYSKWNHIDESEGLYARDKLDFYYESWKVDNRKIPDFKMLGKLVMQSTNMNMSYAYGFCRHFMKNNTIDFDGLMRELENYNLIKDAEREFLNKFVMPHESMGDTDNGF